MAFHLQNNQDRTKLQEEISASLSQKRQSYLSGVDAEKQRILTQKRHKSEILGKIVAIVIVVVVFFTATVIFLYK